MKSVIKTLFLAAHVSELKPLVTLGRKYLCVDGDTAFLAAGVGPVAATFGLTHFLEDYRPEKIIAIGTAGVINEKNFSIGDVVVAKSVSTVSGCGAVYTPKLQPQKIVLCVGARRAVPTHWQTIAGTARRAPTGKSANIFSPQEITRDDTMRHALCAAKHDVEHLEAFAFAFVAKKFHIPIQIVLGLTNVAGKNAHRDWVKNAEMMVKKVCGLFL